MNPIQVQYTKCTDAKIFSAFDDSVSATIKLAAAHEDHALSHVRILKDGRGSSMRNLYWSLGHTVDTALRSLPNQRSQSFLNLFNALTAVFDFAKPVMNEAARATYFMDRVYRIYPHIENLYRVAAGLSGELARRAAETTVDWAYHTTHTLAALRTTLAANAKTLQEEKLDLILHAAGVLYKMEANIRRGAAYRPAVSADSAAPRPADPIQFSDFVPRYSSPRLTWTKTAPFNLVDIVAEKTEIPCGNYPCLVGLIGVFPDERILPRNLGKQLLHDVEIIKHLAGSRPSTAYFYAPANDAPADDAPADDAPADDAATDSTELTITQSPTASVPILARFGRAAAAACAQSTVVREKLHEIFRKAPPFGGCVHALIQTGSHDYTVGKLTDYVDPDTGTSHVVFTFKTRADNTVIKQGFVEKEIFPERIRAQTNASNVLTVDAINGTLDISSSSDDVDIGALNQLYFHFGVLNNRNMEHFCRTNENDTILAERAANAAPAVFTLQRNYGSLPPVLAKELKAVGELPPEGSSVAPSFKIQTSQVGDVSMLIDIPNTERQAANMWLLQMLVKYHLRVVVPKVIKGYLGSTFALPLPRTVQPGKSLVATTQQVTTVITPPPGWDRTTNPWRVHAGQIALPGIVPTPDVIAQRKLTDVVRLRGRPLTQFSRRFDVVLHSFIGTINNVEGLSANAQCPAALRPMVISEEDVKDWTDDGYTILRAHGKVFVCNKASQFPYPVIIREKIDVENKRSYEKIKRSSVPTRLPAAVPATVENADHPRPYPICCRKVPGPDPPGTEYAPATAESSESAPAPAPAASSQTMPVIHTIMYNELERFIEPPASLARFIRGVLGDNYFVVRLGTISGPSGSTADPNSIIDAIRRVTIPGVQNETQEARQDGARAVRADIIKYATHLAIGAGASFPDANPFASAWNGRTARIAAALAASLEDDDAPVTAELHHGVLELLFRINLFVFGTPSAAKEPVSVRPSQCEPIYPRHASAWLAPPVAADNPRPTVILYTYGNNVYQPVISLGISIPEGPPDKESNRHYPGGMKSKERLNTWPTNPLGVALRSIMSYCRKTLHADISSVEHILRALRIPQTALRAQSFDLYGKVRAVAVSHFGEQFIIEIPPAAPCIWTTDKKPCQVFDFPFGDRNAYPASRELSEHILSSKPAGKTRAQYAPVRGPADGLLSIVRHNDSDFVYGPVTVCKAAPTVAPTIPVSVIESAVANRAIAYIFIQLLVWIVSVTECTTESFEDVWKRVTTVTPTPSDERKSKFFGLKLPRLPFGRKLTPEEAVTLILNQNVDLATHEDYGFLDVIFNLAGEQGGIRIQFPEAELHDAVKEYMGRVVVNGLHTRVGFLASAADERNGLEAANAFGSKYVSLMGTYDVLPESNSAPTTVVFRTQASLFAWFAAMATGHTARAPSWPVYVSGGAEHAAIATFPYAATLDA